MAGGHADNNYTNDVWVSPDAGASWKQVLANSTAPWKARSYHSCVALPGGRLLLVAGHAGNEWFNDVWVSGANDFATWTQVTEQAEFPKRAAGSLQYQATTGKIFYMGGSNGLLPPVGRGTTLYNDVWASEDEGATWKQVTDSAGWKAREGFTGQSSGMDVVVAGQSLAVMGGEEGYFPGSYFSDIWTSEDGATWTERKKKAEWAGASGGSIWNLKGRSGHIVASEPRTDGSQTLWLSGGFLGRSDVWCINVKDAEDLKMPWTRVAKSSPWHGRFDHIMSVVGSKLVLFGGENSAAGFGGPYYNDVWTAELEECPTSALMV